MAIVSELAFEFVIGGRVFGALLEILTRNILHSFKIAFHDFLLHCVVRRSSERPDRAGNNEMALRSAHWACFGGLLQLVFARRILGCSSTPASNAF